MIGGWGGSPIGRLSRISFRFVGACVRARDLVASMCAWTAWTWQARSPQGLQKSTARIWPISTSMQEIGFGFVSCSCRACEREGEAKLCGRVRGECLSTLMYTQNEHHIHLRSNVWHCQPEHHSLSTQQCTRRHGCQRLVATADLVTTACTVSYTHLTLPTILRV